MLMSKELLCNKHQEHQQYILFLGSSECTEHCRSDW